MRSVVRRDCQRRAFAKFVFEDDEILVSEADDGVNFATERMKFARDRKRDGASYAAADDTYLLRPSVSVARPRGPTKSSISSPTFFEFNFAVVAPTI